jgi:hypothetical protein
VDTGSSVSAAGISGERKELLHMFLRGSQIENAVIRRMNLYSFIHGKSRDCGALSWRLSGAMGRMTGKQSVIRIVYEEKK